MRSLASILAGTALLAAVGVAAAQDAAPAAPPPGVADRGGDIYRDRCALCHGAHMDDGEFGPSLKSARFQRTWGKAGTAALYAYVSHAMPPGQVGQLSEQDYVDVVAYLFQINAAAPATP